MSGEQRTVIAGSDRAPVPGAELVGAPHPDERLEVTVRLRSRAGGQLAAHVQALAAPAAEGAAVQPHLSREQFAERFGADPADIARVTDFANRAGLAVVDTSAARRSVVLSGTVAQFAAAFGVELELFSHPDGGSFRGRQGPVRIPAGLQDVVEGVFGLDDRPQAAAHFRRLADSDGVRPGLAATSASFTPDKVGHLYDFPSDATGEGECVAIIELGGGSRARDLTAYFKELGIAPTPKVVSVLVDHAHNRPDGPDGADGEVMLDIEVVGAVAPRSRIAVYFAPNTDQGFLDAVTTAVHDTTNRPSVVSISWGAAEVAWTQAAMQAMDQAFQEAAAMGVTIYCASGDNGANDFAPGPDRQPGNHVDFPASSPHVVGCGGTRITVSGDELSQEVVWNDTNGGATGGGISTVFPKPSWQDPVVSGTMRGVPDVAGDASPQSGYQVRVDGQQFVIGGTSAVAPLWAGLTALITQKRGAPVGFINPQLYSLIGTPALQDITDGNNNGFTAGPGWDACTGVGRPVGTKLAAALA